MAFKFVSATLAGSSSATAQPVDTNLQAGSSFAPADLNIDNAVTATPGGSATVFADFDFKLAVGATVAGVGVLAPSDPERTVALAASLTGAASLSAPSPSLLKTVTGQVAGTSSMIFPPTQVEAALAGSASMAAADFTRTRTASPAGIRGTGLLVLSEPMPIRGSSSMAAHYVVEAVPLPVEVAAALGSQTIFRWNQQLQRGDLPIYIRGHFRTGNPGMSSGPVSPMFVGYTFFQKKGAFLSRIGPEDQTPVNGDVGEFYATGCFGMFGGQPGEWVIRWKFQKDPLSVLQVKDMEFTVQDNVAANDPRDQTPRVRKYGWL